MRLVLVPTLVVLFAAAASAQSPRDPAILELEQQIAGKEKLPAEEVFENIQTFKGMPAIGVLRVMEMAFAANLGVQCDYCHVAGKWASDEKRQKPIARAMWALRREAQDEVRKAVGSDKAVVTCYTCHKGQPIPAFAPP